MVAIVVAVGLAPAVVPAFAADDDETLVANDFFFDPDEVTIAGSDPLEVRTLRVAAASFCTRRGGGCANPGVKVRIDLSASARVTGTLTRRPPRGKARAKRFGRVDFGTVAAGARTLSFTRNAAGKRLTAGCYQLELTVTGGAARTLSFRVR